MAEYHNFVGYGPSHGYVCCPCHAASLVGRGYAVNTAEEIEFAVKHGAESGEWPPVGWVSGWVGGCGYRCGWGWG